MLVIKVLFTYKISKIMVFESSYSNIHYLLFALSSFQWDNITLFIPGSFSLLVMRNFNKPDITELGNFKSSYGLFSCLSGVRGYRSSDSWWSVNIKSIFIILLFYYFIV